MALDTELDRLIRRARGAEGPAAPVRAEVRRGLQRQLDAGVHDPGFEAAALAPEAARWPRARVWGVPLVGLGVLSLIWLQLAPQPVDPLVRAPQPAPVTAPAQPPAAPAAVSPAAVSPAAALASAAAASAPALALAAAPAAVTAPAPAAAPVRVAAPASALPARVAPAPRAPDLLAESQALARVQRALRDDQPARALMLLEQQEREFARGVLHQERAAARALALCSAGRGAEGQRAAATFVARYPESVLSARVQSRCAAASREGHE